MGYVQTTGCDRRPGGSIGLAIELGLGRGSLYRIRGQGRERHLSTLNDRISHIQKRKIEFPLPKRLGIYGQYQPLGWRSSPLLEAWASGLITLSQHSMLDANGPEDPLHNNSPTFKDSKM